MITVDTELRRHECEVRYVATMKSDEARHNYLEGVATKRGADAAKRLREDAWKLIQQAKPGQIG